MSHTPGPWTLDACNSIHGPGINPEVTMLAAVRFQGGDNAKGVANARLMAAAPELLRVLEQAEKEIRRLHLLHVGMFEGKIGEPRLRIAQKARLLINKAKGTPRGRS